MIATSFLYGFNPKVKDLGFESSHIAVRTFMLGVNHLQAECWRINGGLRPCQAVIKLHPF